MALTAVARTSASAQLLCGAAFQKCGTQPRSGAMCSVTGAGVGGGGGPAGGSWVGRDFQIALNVC